MRSKTLRILLLSDEMVDEKRIRPELFESVDLIISCGDLPGWYLSMIADLSMKDVLYVAGNHDTKYVKNPPLGCICIDDQIYNWHGVRILGLGGSHVYNGTVYQYTQKEMQRRYWKIRIRNFFHTPIDLLVTHSPAWQLNDGRDPAHQGFKVFRTILEKLKPLYFIHGHVHMNYGNYPRISRYEETTIINAFQSFVLEIPWSAIEARNEDPSWSPGF